MFLIKGEGNTGTVNNINVGNVRNLLDDDDATRHAFCEHIEDSDIVYRLDEEPRKALMGIFRDVFFNPKRKDNMVVAIPNIDPLSIFLHSGKSWEQAPDIVLNQFANILAYYMNEVRARQRLPPAKINSIWSVVNNMTKDFAKVANDNLQMVADAHGVLNLPKDS